MASRRTRWNAVGVWLAACVAVVFAMIVVGGATRLARAGLSITTWDPVTGVVPPLGDAAWHAALDRYRHSPEGRLVNEAMTLEEFRGIYLLEYGHRLLGRVVGLVLVGPLVYFAARRRLGWRRAGQLVGVLALGAGQGVLGWYMVASGLVDEPHVSPYRLASHLVVGMMLLSWLAWNAATELFPPRATQLRGGARKAAIVSALLAFVTVAYGGLMAGHHAGLLCSTFPKMNGAWVPPGARFGAPAALVEDAWTVHFLHRALALSLAVAVATTCVMAWRTGLERLRLLGLAALLVVVAQIALGALLVVGDVPALLASLHQANGALLLVLLVGVVRAATASSPARWSAEVVELREDRKRKERLHATWPRGRASNDAQ